MCVFTTILGSVGLAIAANVALGVGAVAGIAGSALGAVSSYQQGKAQAAAANYKAQVERQNQRIALENAAMERQEGLEEARRQRMATLQEIGKQQVGLAANGVDVGYGTSLDIIEDTAMLGELDALTIEYNSEKRARNYDMQAYNFANEANLATYEARNARTAGNMGAIAGGLKTVGQIASTVVGFAGGLGSLGSNVAGRTVGIGTGTKLSGGVDFSSNAAILDRSAGILGA